jgi:hypothetical protein
MPRTARQERAMALHAKRMAKMSADADRHYAQLRAAFPTYGAPYEVTIAARFSDDVRRGAQEFGRNIGN